MMCVACNPLLQTPRRSGPADPRQNIPVAIDDIGGFQAGEGRPRRVQPDGCRDLEERSVRGAVCSAGRGIVEELVLSRVTLATSVLPLAETDLVRLLDGAEY